MNKSIKNLGIMLTLIAALFMITGCPQEVPQDAKKHTVTIATYGEEGKIVPLSFTVQEGDTLESIADLAGVSLESFDFVGFYTADGKEFAKTKPITSDLNLYARFEKKTATEEKDPANSNVTVKEEKTETKTADVSEVVVETTTTTTVLDNGKTEVKIESTTTETTSEKTTTTEETTNIAADGSSTSNSETVVQDSTGKTISTAETNVTTDAEGNSTSVTTDDKGNETIQTTDADGNSTTVTTDSEGNKTTVTKDFEGNATTVTEDKDGNVNVEIKPADEATVESIINSGIKAISEGNIISAKSFFEAAYAKDPNNDQAKVVSALVDLASISTNEKLGEFFKDHFGIQNYPGTLNALIAGDWLRASTYEVENPFYLYTSELKEVKTPKEGDYYYYKASFYSNDIDDYWDVYKQYEKEGIVRSNTYKLKTIDGKNYLFSVNNERNYEHQISETYNFPEEGLFFEILAPDGSYDTYKNNYYKIDGKGEYLVWAEYNADYPGPCYKGEYKDYLFKGKTTYIAPTFASMEKENWFATATTNETYFAQLVTANLLKGNVNGLDSAIDDLYEALFNSNEYKSAIAKIDSVKADVIIPGSLVKALELKQFYGEGEKIKLGKTELNLIKALLNIYKGIFEYVQSIDLSSDLSFFETDKLFHDTVPELKSNEEFEEPDEFELYLMEKLTGYDATIDPLANKFLSTRDEDKLAASKETFVSVIDDIVAAYDSITGEKSIYPSVVGEYAKKGKVFRDAAVLLRTAIADGGAFYIPQHIDGIPAAWPTADGNGIISVDMKELFGKDLFAIGTYLDLCTIGEDKHEAPALYTITGKDKDNNYIFKNITEVEQFEFDENIMIFIKLDISRLQALTNMAAMIPLKGEYMPIPAEAFGVIYQFYYTVKETE